jgi:16S rRNA (adenine1518-N6/adenine1519-N6)-dimethyltransferase
MDEKKCEEKTGNSLYVEVLNAIKRYSIKPDLSSKDQHFLISRNIIAQLINSARINEHDVVLEIGPGLGQITEAIAQRAKKVYAIEIDRNFGPPLKDLERKYKNLKVIFSSALKVKWPVVNKVVSNPPYAIWEPLLKILIRKKGIKSFVFIVGKKYYQRCTSQPENMTVTSLMTQTFFNVECVSQLNGQEFFPSSHKKSVIIKLVKKRGKDIDFNLKMLVLSLIETPNKLVIDLMREITSRSMVISSLILPDSLLKKRLRTLKNKDVTLLVKALKLLELDSCY